MVITQAITVVAFIIERRTDTGRTHTCVRTVQGSCNNYVGLSVFTHFCMNGLATMNRWGVAATGKLISPHPNALIVGVESTEILQLIHQRLLLTR